MTGRGRILVFLSLIGAIFGILRAQDTLSILSLAALFWVFSSWALFSINIALVWPSITLERTLNGKPADKVTLWSDRVVSVSVKVNAAGGKIPALSVISDQLPELLRIQSGSRTSVTTRSSEALELNYACRVLAAGRAELPGVHCQFRDPQGLFNTERFLEAKVPLRILPSFAEVGDSHPTIKRVNSLPQHGIHRMQRAGLGSELLELREYQSGDPPKSIAWKVSARRDRLMTRQYESEVPVRITLFVDGSDINRLGGFGLRQMDQINFLAASVARSTISAGDSIGLVLLNKQEVRRIAPAFGERAFYRTLDALADFAHRPPDQQSRYSWSLQAAALSVAQRRYPELLTKTVNRVPFTILPLLPASRLSGETAPSWRDFMASCFICSRPRLVGCTGTISCSPISRSDFCGIVVGPGCLHWGQRNP